MKEIHPEQIHIGSKGAKLVKKLLKQLGYKASRISRPHHQMTVGSDRYWVFTERKGTGRISFESWSDHHVRFGWFGKLRNLHPCERPKYLMMVCLNEHLPLALPTIRMLDTERLIDFIYKFHQHYPELQVHMYEESRQMNDTRIIAVPEAHLAAAGVLTKVYRWNREIRKFEFLMMENYL